MTTIPVVSQLKSGFQWITGDSDGAKKTWNTFVDAWENHPLQQISDIADVVPGVGHVKGIVHLATGDVDGFWKAEKAATRTTLVMGATALAPVGAPILGGVALAVGAGALYDAGTTLISSAHHGEFDPQGYIGTICEAKDDPRSAIFDTLALALGDGYIGYAKGAGSAAAASGVAEVAGETAAAEAAELSGAAEVSEVHAAVEPARVAEPAAGTVPKQLSRAVENDAVNAEPQPSGSGIAARSNGAAETSNVSSILEHREVMESASSSAGEVEGHTIRIFRVEGDGPFASKPGAAKVEQGYNAHMYQNRSGKVVVSSRTIKFDPRDLGSQVDEIAEEAVDESPRMYYNRHGEPLPAPKLKGWSFGKIQEIGSQVDEIAEEAKEEAPRRLYRNRNGEMRPVPRHLRWNPDKIDELGAQVDEIAEDPLASGDHNPLFLNFGDEARAESYIAQKLIQYKNAVVVLENKAANSASATEAMASREPIPPFNMRIKSFRVLASDVEEVVGIIPEDNVSEWTSKGVLRVDLTKTGKSLQCPSHVYTPILEKAIPGSYVEYTPTWMTDLENLSIEQLEKIRDGKVTDGCVRTATISKSKLTRNVLKTEVSERISDADLRNENGIVPASVLNEAGLDSVEISDEPIRAIRQERHVKCGRKVSTDVNHGEHFEYLVEFRDGSKQWVPSQFVAQDLKEAYYERLTRNATEVREIVESNNQTAKVRLSSGIIRTIAKSQIFWLEEDPSSHHRLSEGELHAVLHHDYCGSDYDKHTSATLAYRADWAKVEILSPGVILERDPNIPDPDQIYSGVTFERTSLSCGDIRGPFSARKVPFIIRNDGTPIDIRVTHGNDLMRRSNRNGAAIVTIDGVRYVNRITTNLLNEEVFKNCHVKTVLPMGVPSKLICQSDWAKIEILTPGTVIDRDPRLNGSAYEKVSLTATSLMFNKYHAHMFNTAEIPFCIFNDGSPFDVRITHGRDKERLGDKTGSACLIIGTAEYTNDFSGEEFNEKLFKGIRLNCAYGSLCCHILIAYNTTGYGVPYTLYLGLQEGDSKADIDSGLV